MSLAKRAHIVFSEMQEAGLEPAKALSHQSLNLAELPLSDSCK